ncbi:MAG: efflux RND transporter periplasmic adaptor subunit [Flavobacteriaceae bacterium]|nr:efflux RND transporter periplasmic adaptor subunit [Flavobacteriaceae bacterium]
MKKHIYILTFAFIFFSCDNKKDIDTNSIINSKDLKLIQKRKSQVSSEINLLQKELRTLNEEIFNLDEERKITLVSSKKVKKESFKHFIEIQGSVESDKNLILYSEIPGIIKSINVKQGQKVKKGLVLVELSNEGMFAKLEQLKLQLKLAKTTYERQSNLWNDKIGSEIQFLQTKTNYLTIEREIVQINDQILKSKIIAPFDGVIDQLIADLGSNVNPGISPVLRIINLDQVKVIAEIPETHLPNIHYESEVSIYFPVISKNLKAKVSSIGNVINPNNRNFRIEVLLENNDYVLKPNMTAKISLNDYHNPNAILIDQKNIIENSYNEFYVFKLEPVAMDQEKYKVIKNLVKLGKTANNKVEILEGLDSDDIIIEDGSRLVREKQIVKITNRIKGTN